MGDSALWEGGLFEVRAVSEGFAWLRALDAIGHLETAPLSELKRPAPEPVEAGVRVHREPGNTLSITGPTHMDAFKLTPAEALELLEQLKKALGE